MYHHLMKLVTPRTVTLLGFGLVLFGGCSGPERTVYRGGNSFFPLLDGRVLHYEEHREGTIREYSLRIQYAGGHVSKIYTTYFKGADFGECSFVSRDSDVVFSTNDPLTAMMPRGTLPEYRQLWVDASAKKGNSWQDEDTGTETTFSGFEPVEVPAGKFDHCYKTMTQAQALLFDSLTVWRDRGELKASDYERELESARQLVVRWFAPGVGLVKEQIGTGVIRVLTKIEKEGTGVTDTTQTQTYEIQG